MRGIASGQHEKRSTTVKRYRKPSLGGNGPTMSTWMLPNRLSAGSYLITGAAVWRAILEAWQAWQALHQARTSFFIPGQTYRALTSLRQGRTPG